MDNKKMSFLERKGGSRVFANDGERLIADIQMAIPSLSVDDYTKGGKPRLEAIAALLNEPVTEAQRDQAWSAMSIDKGEQDNDEIS